MEDVFSRLSKEPSGLRWQGMVRGARGAVDLRCRQQQKVDYIGGVAYSGGPLLRSTTAFLSYFHLLLLSMHTQTLVFL